MTAGDKGRAAGDPGARAPGVLSPRKEFEARGPSVSNGGPGGPYDHPIATQRRSATARLDRPQFIRDIATISRGQSANTRQSERGAEGPMRNYWESAGRRRPSDETAQAKSPASVDLALRADLYTLFKIDPTRSGDVLIEVLGKELTGFWGATISSAYRRYHREFGVTLQFCLAHLIRDVKFLTTLPDVRVQTYGTRLRARRYALGVIHRREQLTALQFQSQLGAGAEVRSARPTCGSHHAHWEGSRRRRERSRPESSRPTIWRSKRFDSW